MTLRSAIGAALVLGLVACAPRLEVGTPCSSATDCTAPLTCELGRCRTECLSDRDCPLGVTCARAGDGSGVCTLEVENRCTGMVCPSPLVCDADRCRAACSSDGDCLASQTCASDVCVAREVAPDTGVPEDASTPFVEPRLCAGSCGTGEVCASDYPPTVCRAACDEHTDCPRPSACDSYFADVDGGFLFGCATVCRPGTTDGCPAGTSCRMVGLFPLLPGGPPSITHCSPFRATGVEGCSCENLDSSQECAAGFSCEMPPAGRMCLRICEMGTDCAPGVPCERTPRSLVIGTTEYGVCPSSITTPLACP